MKFFISFICLFVSLYANAQVRTGGTPPLAKELEDKLREFANHLQERDLVCNKSKSKSHGPRETQITEHRSFQEMAGDVTLYKIAAILSYQCEEANRYMNCLNDSITKDSIKELLLFKKSLSPLLGTLHELDDKESEPLILFLESFESDNCTSLQKNSCGM